jgi:hypothetical protein
VPLETEPEEDDDEGWFDQRAVDRYMQTVFDVSWWQPPERGTAVILVG